MKEQAFKALGSFDVTRALKNQDWYAVQSDSGATTALYSWPSGAQPSANLLADMKAGQTVTKVDNPWWVGQILLSKEQLTSILETLMSNARAAVCAMSGRPTTFGTEVDISAGVGIEGRIAFNVQWDTDKLCAS